MLNFLGKLVRMIRILATIAVIVILIFEVASRLDLKSMFGPQIEYDSGIYTSDGYISSFLGYKFTAPEGCDLATIEERAEQSELSVAGLTTAQIEEEFKGQASVMDLLAVMPSNVNVIVSISINTRISEDDVEAGVKEIVNGLRRQGISVSNDYELVEYLGRNCGKYIANTNINGTQAIQEGYVFTEEGYAWMIIFSYVEGLEADKEQLVNAFSVYE